MHRITVLLAIACTLSAIGILTAQQESQKGEANAKKPQAIVDRYAMTYPIEDLAVWSENGEKFDASILVALIKAKVTPDAWNGENDIYPFFSDSPALIIRATEGIHDKIANELIELRKNQNEEPLDQPKPEPANG